jgi:hypothetical protein
MPQNWLFLTSYRKQRESLLKRVQWNFLARLGPGAFETISGEVVQAILLTQTNAPSAENFTLRGVDVSSQKQSIEKSVALSKLELLSVPQSSQLNNADSRVSLEAIATGTRLGDLAWGLHGQGSFDDPCYVMKFWEKYQLNGGWIFQQTTGVASELFSGLTNIFRWEDGCGMLARYMAAKAEAGYTSGKWKAGQAAWGRLGIAVSGMTKLFINAYSGGSFDTNVAVIVPKKKEDFLPIWSYLNSNHFISDIRAIDKNIKVSCNTYVKVPFDLDHWKEVVTESYPNGLPQPYSDTLTQWLFHGHPQPSTEPLQVALARLLGYNWPAETDPEMELSDEARTWITRCEKLAAHTDDDGIVCLPSVRGEKAAHDRLLDLLIDAWETVEPGSWKTGILDKLLTDADCAGKGLDIWLREKFFEQHSKLFHHRPFIWHIWDGLKDGFGALVNYHTLDTKNLERLIHTYLGDWIRQQEAGVRDGVDGAQTRLAAAQVLKKKLELILEGEAPYDIFVRWKPLEQQPIGWNPDLNDGVRINIRPFMTAEVLRHNKKPKLNITWDKDRGKDVESAPWFHKFGGERINDHHLTLAEKRQSRLGKGNGE